MASILITQCMQNDFVQPRYKHEKLPNQLHIGYREAERLVGENPDEGPVAHLMNWAYGQNAKALEIIHIRDWHDRDDPHQQAHLQQFGLHCIKNTKGAEFVFQKQVQNGRHKIINASGLNDFIDTELGDILEHYKNDETKIGLTGVWTEAKISFLTYELASRFPNFKIALCSALTASSSTAMHYLSLKRLENLFGITIFSSIADFTTFLTGSIPDFCSYAKTYGTKLEFDKQNNISTSDRKLLTYLFRESDSVSFKVLDGGYSGNVVLKSASTDVHGHKQVPSVIKIGNRQLISKERDSFEQIKDVLGNNAPSITDYAEDEHRGAIKYRYAAMYGDTIQTLQQVYKRSYNKADFEYYLDVIFREDLGKLYEARKLERLNLLRYYDFDAKYADSVKKNIETVIGQTITGEEICLEGRMVFNPANLYSHVIDNAKHSGNEQYFMSYIHGDLNGANIIIDGQKNVWLIDFFHTHYGHVLKDLIKLENDLLFIFMQINSKDSFLEATKLIDHITNVPDIAYPPVSHNFKNSEIQQASDTVIHLRSYYADLIDSNRDPFQYYVAMLRYSMHSLTFEECNDWQKKLALYMGSICAKKITDKLSESKKLRLDFLQANGSFKQASQISLTLLPGRKDMKRNLADDINVIKENGISSILTLVTEEELQKHGVSNLLSEFKRAGFNSFHLPVKDQGVPSHEEIETVCRWLHTRIRRSEKVLIHCVGGLGRTGTIAALYLKKTLGLSAEDAIRIVRKSRSPRAIESKEQIKIIETY